MIEAAVEMDDDAMGAYLDGKEPDVDTLKRLIRKATVKSIFYPMLCGSAFKYKGVQPLLDAVVDYLPSPADREAFEAIDVKTGEPAVRRPLDSDPLSCWRSRSWTTRTSARSPSAASTRARCKSGMALANTTRDKKERVGRMCLMHANDREQIDEAYAGDIIALAGLKDTRTGETLSDPQQARAAREDGVPQPRHRDAGRAQDQGRRWRRWAWRSPSWRPRTPRSASTTDQESGETIIKGMGELHLDIKVDILQAHAQGRGQRRRAAGGLPRDHRARSTDIDYTHKKQTGGTGQFARVKLDARAERAGRGQRVRERDRRRRGAEGVHPRRREGRAERVGLGRR